MNSQRPAKACADHLSLEFNHAGYTDLRFFSVPDNGFALVTRMERIYSNERPFPGESRWQDSIKLSLESFSIRDYLLALFSRRSGRFRVFVIIVTTSDVLLDKTKQLQVETVQRWQQLGSLSLPLALRQQLFSNSYKVYILVYEFKKEEGEPPEMVKDGPSATEHLKAAGLHLGSAS